MFDENKGISMAQYIEEKFAESIRDVPLCKDENLDICFYVGYFQCATDLGLISEDRQEEMMDMLRDAFSQYFDYK